MASGQGRTIQAVVDALERHGRRDCWRWNPAQAEGKAEAL